MCLYGVIFNTQKILKYYTLNCLYDYDFIRNVERQYKSNTLHKDLHSYNADYATKLIHVLYISDWLFDSVILQNCLFHG